MSKIETEKKDKKTTLEIIKKNPKKILAIIAMSAALSGCVGAEKKSRDVVFPEGKGVGITREGKSHIEARDATEIINTKYNGKIEIVKDADGMHLKERKTNFETKKYDNIEYVNGFFVGSRKNKNNKDVKVILGNGRNPSFFTELKVQVQRSKNTLLFGYESDRSEPREYSEVKPLGDNLVAYHSFQDGNGSHKAADLFEQVERWDDDEFKYNMINYIGLGDQNLLPINPMNNLRGAIEEYKEIVVDEKKFLVEVSDNGGLRVIKKKKNNFKHISTYQSDYVTNFERDDIDLFTEIKKKDGHVMGITETGLQYPLFNDGALKFDGSWEKITNIFKEDVELVVNKNNATLLVLKNGEQLRVTKMGPFVLREVSPQRWAFVDQNGEPVIKLDTIPTEHVAGDSMVYLFDGDVYHGYYNKNTDEAVIADSATEKKGFWGSERYATLKDNLIYIKSEKSEKTGRYRPVCYGVDIESGKIKKKIGKKDECTE